MRNEEQDMRVFAEQLWKNYMEPQVEKKMALAVRYFRAQVVSNPGNNTLEIQRPGDANTMTLPCMEGISGAQTGDQVVVFVLGNLSNAIVVSNGTMDSFETALLEEKANVQNGIYPVIGTQTEKTGTWTGDIDLPEIYEGLTIAYYLPYAGDGNATLELTLSDGTTTGPVEVYFTATSRVNTHYGAGSTILLTYWPAGNISVSGTPTTADRWTRADYSRDSPYQIMAYGIPGYAGANGVMRNSIIMQDGAGAWQSFTTNGGTGTTKTRNTTGFRLGYILYTNRTTAASAGAALTSSGQFPMYAFNAAYSFNCGTNTLTQYAPLYLVGTLNSSDGLFYLDAVWWTQTLPSTEDGKLYVQLGYMYSAYQMMLMPTHPIYEYKNGAVRLWQDG